MTEIVAPKPEFLSLTEAAVLAALGDPDPANPIAVEISRLVTAYKKTLGTMWSGSGTFPPTFCALNPAGPLKPLRCA
jgi:hypothetical protein